MGWNGGLVLRLGIDVGRELRPFSLTSDDRNRGQRDRKRMPRTLSAQNSFFPVSLGSASPKPHALSKEFRHSTHENCSVSPRRDFSARLCRSGSRERSINDWRLPSQGARLF